MQIIYILILYLMDKVILGELFIDTFIGAKWWGGGMSLHYFLYLRIFLFWLLSRIRANKDWCYGGGRGEWVYVY